MSNFNCKELNNIIRDFAYGQGQSRKIKWLLVRLEHEQKRLEERLAQIPLEVAEAKEALAIAEKELAAINADLALKYPKIPTKRIRAIIATPKIHGLQWGDFNREIISIIKSGNGEPVPTSEIMRRCAEKFKIPCDTPLLRESLRDRIGKRLREWVKKGVIKRLPTAKPKDLAYWVWVGLE